MQMDVQWIMKKVILHILCHYCSQFANNQKHRVLKTEILYKAMVNEIHYDVSYISINNVVNCLIMIEWWQRAVEIEQADDNPP
jgi:hypothetical protein